MSPAISTSRRVARHNVLAGAKSPHPSSPPPEYPGARGVSRNQEPERHGDTHHQAEVRRADAGRLRVDASKSPSTIRKENTVLAQILLFRRLFTTRRPRPRGPTGRTGPTSLAGLGYAVLTVGIVLILHHCFVDRETTFRRLYMMLGFLLLGAALLTPIFLSAAGPTTNHLRAFSCSWACCFVPALAFFVGVLLGETDAFWRRTIRLELGVGVLGLAYGVICGFFQVDLLTGHGLLAIAAGLAYVMAYSARRPACGNRARRL